MCIVIKWFIRKKTGSTAGFCPLSQKSNKACCIVNLWSIRPFKLTELPNPTANTYTILFACTEMELYYVYWMGSYTVITHSILYAFILKQHTEYHNMTYAWHSIIYMYGTIFLKLILSFPGPHGYNFWMIISRVILVHLSKNLFPPK